MTWWTIHGRASEHPVHALARHGPLICSAVRRAGADAQRAGGWPTRACLFRQAFCAAPTCSASRACLLNGPPRAERTGCWGLAHRGWWRLALLLLSVIYWLQQLLSINIVAAGFNCDINRLYPGGNHCRNAHGNFLQTRDLFVSNCEFAAPG